MNKENKNQLENGNMVFINNNIYIGNLSAFNVWNNVV